ncbi:hypothetical protein AAG570_005864 [Ranatra chinensis]|uniref:Amidase domain-containing protein n=1 Tax=Ranatra chinensis TaxID=642074 RepID=A0ABD0YI49_9HEMI
MVASRPDDGYWKRNRPLLGVPLTVKESIAVQGMSNTSGMGNGKVAERDAVCVANLRCLGAIVLAVTNVPQMCSFWETSNPAFGTTNNPYDTRRTAGGSSGGEGALLGSAGSVIGIGSDLGGSLRLPANFCGVFAHKPTPGLVSVDGHTPTCSDPRWPFYFCLGPMARYSEDLPLVLECMILTKDRPHALNLHEWADMRHLNIFYMEGEGPKSVLPDTITTEVKDTLIKAVKYLKMEHNCKPKKVCVFEIY